mgnify:CR=1 FL=1
MSPRAKLAVDADLQLTSGSTTIEVKGDGDRLDVRIGRWRDLPGLLRHASAARRAIGIWRQVGIGGRVHVRGLPVYFWSASS